MSIYFEGTEKKLEIVLKDGVSNLLEWDEGFWNGLVELAGAKILSQVTNEQQKACNAMTKASQLGNKQAKQLLQEICS